METSGSWSFIVCPLVCVVLKLCVSEKPVPPSVLGSIQAIKNSSLNEGWSRLLRIKKETSVTIIRKDRKSLSGR